MRTLSLKIRRAVEMAMALFLLAMVALTFVDVIGRRLFGEPVYGANDITEHLMALVVFAGLPLVTAAGAHLTIDLLDKLLDRPELAWWRTLIGLLVASVFGVMAWLFIKHGLNAMQISEVSQALRIPRAPLYFFIALSCALSALASLAVVFDSTLADAKNTQKEEVL